MVDSGAMIRPGKAARLKRIREIGAIAAARRPPSMRHTPAGRLVETLNAMFIKLLVVSIRRSFGYGDASQPLA